MNDQVDVYLSLLVLIHLLDKNKGEEALHCANMLMAKIDSQNRYIWSDSLLGTGQIPNLFFSVPVLNYCGIIPTFVTGRRHFKDFTGS
jgi:hypothetical protein